MYENPKYKHWITFFLLNTQIVQDLVAEMEYNNNHFYYFDILIFGWFFIFNHLKLGIIVFALP